MSKVVCIGDCRLGSISGHSVAEGELARQIYVDEAGTGTKDDVCVVAGVIVRGDDHWRLMHEYLQQLKRKYIPENFQNEFIFHAKTISNGRHEMFKSHPELLKIRHLMIKDVLRANKEVGFDVVLGFAKRSDDLADSTSKANEAHIRHLFAFQQMLQASEIFLGFVNELGLLIIEDIPERKSYLKKVKADLQSPNVFNDFPALKGSPGIPIRRIPEPAVFADKEESPLLQYADHCAFAFRRFFSGYRYADELVGALLHSNFPENLCESEAGYFISTKVRRLTEFKQPRTGGNSGQPGSRAN